MRPECKWRHTCVLKHSGKAGGHKKKECNYSHKIERIKRIELRIERQPRGSVLSTICSEEDRMATNTRNNSECHIVAFRKDASVQEKEHDLHWAVFCGDETIIAIRTPLLIRICIVKTGPTCLQNPRNVPRKQGYAFPNKDCYRSYLPDRNQF